MDADPKNDPTYPMKHRTDEEQKGYSWNRPPQQPVNILVLHSFERSNGSAAFGTSMPPSGLSGMIRRLAFKDSESSYGHWLPLLLPDRVNVVEGILDDLMKGHVPNIFAEKGYGAAMKFNKIGLMQRVAVFAAIGTGAYLLLTRNSKKKNHKKTYYTL